MRKAYYEDHKPLEIANANRSRRIRRPEIKARVKELKRALKCARCEQDHPATLQFHHLDPASKRQNISGMASFGFGIGAILSEVAKCEILCANCHAIEHYGQFF